MRVGKLHHLYTDPLSLDFRRYLDLSRNVDVRNKYFFHSVTVCAATCSALLGVTKVHGISRTNLLCDRLSSAGGGVRSTSPPAEPVLAAAQASLLRGAALPPLLSEPSSLKKLLPLLTDVTTSDLTPSGLCVYGLLGVSYVGCCDSQ